jgi:hypothetical protein
MNPILYPSRKLLGSMLAVLVIAIKASAIPLVYNGHEYFLTARASTWMDSEAQAVAQGGHLVAINDAQEAAWIQANFGINTSIWIGFNDLATEGNWVWSNGDPVIYTNWLPGEPNNSLDEDGAVTGGLWGAGWNDLSVTRYQDYGHAGYGLIETVPDSSNSALLLGSAIGCILMIRRRTAVASDPN